LVGDSSEQVSRGGTERRLDLKSRSRPIASSFVSSIVPQLLSCCSIIDEVILLDTDFSLSFNLSITYVGEIADLTLNLLSVSKTFNTYNPDYPELRRSTILAVPSTNIVLMALGLKS